MIELNNNLISPLVEIETGDTPPTVDTLYTSDGVLSGPRSVKGFNSDSLQFINYDGVDAASSTKYSSLQNDDSLIGLFHAESDNAQFDLISGFYFDDAVGWKLLDDVYETGLLYEEDYSANGSQLDLWVPHLKYIQDNFAPINSGTGVQSVTGDGVDNTDPLNPVVSFPDPSDIGLGNVDNTSDVNKPISNATQLALNNKVTKPNPASSFELDILRRSNTPGEFDYYTPVGGSVKINGMLQNVTVIQDGNVNITFSGNTQSFSNTVNQFPRNVANQFPTQDPVNNPNTFYPFIFDIATDRWLENNVDGQIHFWRITARFTRSTTAGNRQMRFILSNPDTGFEQDYSQEIRRISTEQVITANLITVADAGSIGSGYILNIDLDNQNQTTGNTTFLSVDVTRLSLEKL